jgi:transposase InsO family protein
MNLPVAGDRCVGLPPQRPERGDAAVVEYLGWFNNDRLHESLGDVPPGEFEELYAPREPSLISLSMKEGTT